MVLHHWMQRVCSELKYPTFEGKEKRSVGTNLQSSPSTLKLSCRTIIVTSCDEPHKKSFYKFYINIITTIRKMGRRGNSTTPIALAIVAALGLFLVLRKSGGSSDEQAYSPDDPDAAGGARGVCPRTPFFI